MVTLWNFAREAPASLCEFDDHYLHAYTYRPRRFATTVNEQTSARADAVASADLVWTRQSSPPSNKHATTAMGNAATGDAAFLL